MKNNNDKIKQDLGSVVLAIIKREKKTASKVAKEMGMSGQVLRKRLRGGSKFSIDEFSDILNHLGYNINIIKKTDIVNY